MYYLTTVKVDGSRDYVEQEACPDLRQLKVAVEGHIEVVPYFEWFGNKVCVVFCNEEGKLTNKAINTVATYLWWANLADKPFIQDVLSGNIIIVTADTQKELDKL